MGAASSMPLEVFQEVRKEYDLKRVEGLTDIQIFDHIKQFIEIRMNVQNTVETTVES
jgi:hypothetical protein